MLDKFAIANILREIAALLELKEANPYKIKAYKNGAHSLELTEEDIEQLYSDENLEKISGIGPALAGTITELYRTGKSNLLDELKSEFPGVPPELAAIDGLTLKRIQKLQSLNINTKDNLLKACQSGLLGTTTGLGKTLERKLLSTLTKNDNDSQIILEKAKEFSERFTEYMKPRVTSIEEAGELRRWQEVISQFSFVAASDDVKNTKKHFEKFPSLLKCEWQDEETALGYLSNKPNILISVVSPAQYQCKLHESTGSVAHLEKLKKIAHKKHTSLYTFVHNKKAISEQDIYKHLDMSYIPPELREDWGEIEDAQGGDDFNDLITQEDIKGMVHCHTHYSDGNSSIEKMALAVEEMGCSYITITDHSPTASYANGLEIDRLKRQWEEIDRVQEKVKIKILRGTESDILASGALDYPDDILEKFDVIIASIHSRYKMNEDQMTQRIKTCMELPVFKIWGHALGRLLLKRDPVPCRLEEIIDIVAKSPAAIEINGDPHRMDMEPFWLRHASKLGINFVISTDAHSPSDLLNLPFGIHMARRAGLRKNQILNTLSYTEFKKHLRPKVNQKIS